MRGIFAMLGSLRWALLVLVLPVLLMLGAYPGSGGVAMVAAGSLLVLFWGVLGDVWLVGGGRNPRLGLRWDRWSWSLDALMGARTVVGVLSLIACVVVLFVRPGVGWWALGLWIGVLVWTWLDGKLGDRRRYWLSEVVVSLVLVGVPMWVVGRSIRSWAALGVADVDGDGGAEVVVVDGVGAGSVAWGLDEAGVVLLSLLTALLVGGFALLCLLREEVRDAARGARTTATVLGRGGGMVVLALWQVGGIALACVGIEAGVWGWGVATLLGAGAVACSWVLSLRADGLAVGLWWLASAGSLWLALVG